MRRVDNHTTFMCRLSWNQGASTSCNPQSLSRPVIGLLFLFLCRCRPVAGISSPMDRTECLKLLTDVFLTLTELFLCSFLICKANARVKLAKMGHGPHSSTLVVICVILLLFVLFYVLFVCKCVLPPSDNPIGINKFIKCRKTRDRNGL